MTGRPSLVDSNPIRKPGDDLFGRWPFAKSVARIVRDPYNSGLLVLGIEGAWGAGKSSALQMAAEELTRDGRHREVLVSAWRTSSQEQFLANLSYAISTAIRRDWQSAARRIVLAKLARQSLPIQIAIFTPIFYLMALYFLPDVRGWSRIVANNPKTWIEGLGVFGLPVLGYLFSKLSQPAVETFRSMLGGTKADAIGALERFAFDFDVLAAAQPRGTRFVVLVEDLDRCSPAHVIDVLSAIAQLDGHPKANRIAFLLAYEGDKLIKSIAEALKKDGVAEKATDLARDYLEKVVHLELPLPDLASGITSTNPRRLPPTPTVVRGALVSLAFVAVAVMRLAGPWANWAAAWTFVSIVLLFAVEGIARRLMRPRHERFEPEGWNEATSQVQPWLEKLPLRQRARVLSRARAALMFQPQGALSAWEAVSIATLASRWPERFSRENLKAMIGTSVVDIGKDFMLQEVTDAIKAMAAASLETAQFTDPAKLYAVVSTFKR
ncbi:KAP family P-loop NTPase fold protein [Sphingomonas sp. PR090111-T3T-6A]|uniref:KAP family P-loop NTPase fold protein n=1 Tax=Sphingomonas sp. PR090111-T3T-6A TaxID=685778 RepID=UPI00038294B7|nr:P-loop NTPase fold protein [Sphingomonas sp. PR090111-T3T-6A]